ncbi:serine threonine kinase [Fusarium longipes]|uniref:Serine threonine kinase n=1 Tax=Fusarium longipes TaxID=694270 RepID=A0A395T370_9HYPO|nr:serine threonine kinase [Fusarium longipes]
MPRDIEAVISHEARSEEIEIQRRNALQETSSLPVERTTAVKRNSRNMVLAQNGRHQIMVIDDHQTLAAHKDDMKQSAKVISNMAKTAGGNGMDLYRASPGARRPHTCKTGLQIEEAISEMHSVGGTCNMVNCLKNVLDKVLVRSGVKPTSIYIYTDGVWNTEARDVARVICEAMEYLSKHGQPSSTLLFQFIQFGNSVKATQQLASLKGRCMLPFGNEQWNIVDVNHCQAYS